MPIRWDILHLINCAHKEVRGKTKEDEETGDAVTYLERFAEDSAEEGDSTDAAGSEDDTMSEPES